MKQQTAPEQVFLSQCQASVDGLLMDVRKMGFMPGSIVETTRHTYLVTGVRPYCGVWSSRLGRFGFVVSGGITLEAKRRLKDGTFGKRDYFIALGEARLIEAAFDD